MRSFLKLLLDAYYVLALRITHYVLLVTYYSLRITRYVLLITCYYLSHRFQNMGDDGRAAAADVLGHAQARVGQLILARQSAQL